MSRTDSPVSAMFDLQRTAIRQGGQAVKQGLAAQRSANRMALAGLQGQESLQRQGLELAQAATDAYVDASTMTTTGREAREPRRSVDEAFARAKEMHARLFDAMEREIDRGIELFDELSGDYARAVDQAADGLLESYGTVEDESARSVDAFSRQLHEQLERLQEMQDELEDQFERRSERAEELLQQQREEAERFQERLEEEAAEMRGELGRRAEAGRRPEGGQQSRTAGERQERQGSEPARELELIDGLGPTFRERLNEAGIHSIEELVQAGPDAVAEAADTSRERAEDWIEQASG